MRTNATQVLDYEDENQVDGLDYYHINPNAIVKDGEIVTVGTTGGGNGRLVAAPVSIGRGGPDLRGPASCDTAFSTGHTSAQYGYQVYLPASFPESTAVVE